jgi:hypothetical protein
VAFEDNPVKRTFTDPVSRITLIEEALSKDYLPLLQTLHDIPEKPQARLYSGININTEKMHFMFPFPLHFLHEADAASPRLLHLSLQALLQARPLAL